MSSRGPEGGELQVPPGSGYVAVPETPRRRRGARLPTSAPKAMRLVFEAGCVCARQAAVLWPGTPREAAVRTVFRRLHELGLLERDRWRPEFSPANAPWLGLPPSQQGLLRWENVFSLSAEGLRWISDHLEVPFARARSRYNRSYSDARREHTYLRVEASVLIVSGARKVGGLEVVRLESEGGMDRVRLPDRPGRGPRFVEPDGLFEFENRDDPKGPNSLVLLESDTGTQRGVAHLGEKVEAYSEWFLAGGSPTSDLAVRDPPVVLFVSPTKARAAAVRRTIAEAYRRGAQGLIDFHDSRKQEGHENGALGVFCATSLQRLRERGGWGDSYLYLSDTRPGPLLR